MVRGEGEVSDNGTSDNVVVANLGVVRRGGQDRVADTLRVGQSLDLAVDDGEDV